MQWFFAYVVNLVIGFLESSFKKQDHQNSNPNHDKNKNNENDFFSDSKTSTSKNKAAALQAAYEFMELKPPPNAPTLEEVRKQYKKLSLRHHPDRNGGSRESHEAMQKLNACWTLIEKDLSQEEQDNDDEEEDEKERQKRQQEAYQAMRREMQKEMEEERKKHQENKKKFRQCKKKYSSKFHRKQKEMGLDSEAGRRAAYETFCREMMQMTKAKKKEDSTTTSSSSNNNDGPINNMNDIDDHGNQDDPSETKKKDDEIPTSKPKNPIMEYNMDDIVVAMRLGMPDIAIEVMEEQINSYLQGRAQDAFFSRGVREIDLAPLGIDFLKRPLDFDNNTLLHYAVYYEVYQVIQAVCGTALKFSQTDGLEAILYHPNKYGQTSLTFADNTVILMDESIQRLMQSYVTLVQTANDKTKILPAIKSAALRAWDILCNIDAAATFTTVLSFLIGYKIFDVHVLTSLLAVIYTQYLTGDEALNDLIYEMEENDNHVRGIPEATMLVSFLLAWTLIRMTFHFVYPFIMIELVLIMAPFAIAAVLSSMKNRHRRVSSRVVDAVLLPLTLQGYIARYLERLLTFCHGYITPQVICNHRLVKSYFLLLIASLSLATKHFLLVGS